MYDMKELYNRSKCVAFVSACQTDDGGFAHKPGGRTNMEATRFAVDALNSLLGMNCVDYIRANACIKWIEARQNPDGGFRRVVEEGRSELDATYYAIRILTILNRTIPHRNQCLNWLNAQQCAVDSVSSTSCDTDGTYYNVRALEILGAQIRQKIKIVEFIKACEAPGGGFKDIHGDEEDMDRTYEAIHTLSILGESVPHRDLHIKWITMCSGACGGFKNRPTGDTEIRATYWALHSLKLLGVHPAQYGNHIRWVCTCQSTDGGFANDNISASNVWYTYCAVRSLTLLGYL